MTPLTRQARNVSGETPYMAILSPLHTGRRSVQLAIAIGVAVAVHISLWAAALQTEPSLESWSARMAVIVHEELGKLTTVHVQPAKLPPPPVEQPQTEPPKLPQLQEPPAKPKRRPLPRAAKRRQPTAKRQPPARAAAVIAKPADPVDFTSETVATGNATTYAGGATTATGTNTVAVPSDAVISEPTADESRPVRFRGKQWRCPWPQTALSQDIYEQSVLLKVVVTASGQVESVRVLKDPGFGFGGAAVRCARRTKFAPARDAAGKAVRATSPPIRVRFTR